MSQQDSLDLFSEEKMFMKGSHLVTIFHNEENMYSVVRIRVHETNLNYEEKEAVVTGYFPRMHEDEIYIFYGAMKEHPRFGLQFHVEHFRKDLPQSKEGIVSYLQVTFSRALGRKQLKALLRHWVKRQFQKFWLSPRYLMISRSYPVKRQRASMIHWSSIKAWRR